MNWFTISQHGIGSIVASEHFTRTKEGQKNWIVKVFDEKECRFLVVITPLRYP